MKTKASDNEKATTTRSETVTPQPRRLSGSLIRVSQFSFRSLCTLEDFVTIGIMSSEPNATLYIKNIDWKVKKGLLRRALYTLFSRHGKVLDIIALRKDGLRGQAFVIMDTVAAATAALHAEQGFTFFGKDMVIEYAHAKSDRIAKRDGDFVPKAQRQKRKMVNASIETGDEMNEIAKPPDASQVDAATSATSGVGASVGAEPTRILLAQNLPTECNEMMLGMLFQQYPGYKEVRIPQPGMGFIEFEDAAQATVAMNTLDGFKLSPQDTLNLTYGSA
jgi:U2 small nuclear ribonucleoprotein B''